MNQVRQILLLWMTVTLIACQTLGLPTAQTFNERTAVALAGVTTVRDTARALVTTGAISADDAQNIQTQADTAREGINVARGLHASNPGGAENRLSAAVTILQALQTYLNARKP